MGEAQLTVATLMWQNWTDGCGISVHINVAAAVSVTDNAGLTAKRK